MNGSERPSRNPTMGSMGNATPPATPARRVPDASASASESGERSRGGDGAGGMGSAMAIPMTPPDGAADFLTLHGWTGARIDPLAGDASFRRYFRVHDGARRAILMDAPPPHEDPRPFVTMARWLAERSFAAPAILALDLDRGLVLLEDFLLGRIGAQV